MNKHGSASEKRFMSVDQFAEFSGAVVRALPRDIGSSQAQYFIERGDELKRVLRESFSAHSTELGVASALFVWEGFWSKFGIKVDVSKIVVPPRKPGFDRLLVIPGGMTPNKLYDICAQHFPCWRYADNLDEIKPVHIVDGSYAVWVRDRKEADEENKDKSAYDLKEEGVPGITLEERLVYELKFFKETGGHLDKETITLCSGSRNQDGGVPSVCWSRASGRMCVNWYGPENRFHDLSVRTAVS